ncbi:MAG: hydrogenase formation protein HypD [Candidatus Cloacimonadaceae bacterium]|nr:hydrogenase formation protein HypD [Candidatus Cloacimonadaceae bacterium]MDP3113423.1 hydrogenase formation protein HypD [Candidatus Cloacimonadaceae bacterium]
MNLKYYRAPDLIKRVLKEIHEYRQPVTFMEVCGSHTMAIGHWGLRKLLPENIRLISGPGCPVCVTPASVIDELIKLKDITIATFGDLIRVPGSDQTLEHARALGADIRTVYSPLEALELSQKRETVFVGIGFETTIPGIAYTILEAGRQNQDNFSVLPLFKLIPPALNALLIDDEVEIDGFILPGHVSAVIGTQAYDFIPQKFGIGGVVTGFEPLDIVLGIKKMIEQINKPQIINEYSRIVTTEGNMAAKATISEVFSIGNAVWRGLGEIPDSGLDIRTEYSQFDALRKYDIQITNIEGNTACRCSSVLKGKIMPFDCPLFAEICTPNNPVGPCMVSSEGSCAAYYKYEK